MSEQPNLLAKQIEDKVMWTKTKHLLVKLGPDLSKVVRGSFDEYE